MMDLGAIGKGFALDRMAEELLEWGCGCFLLNAGGSSILAGEAPPGAPGWDCGLADDTDSQRYWLAHGSLSGSGLAVKGPHIIDPRTGQSARERPRAWFFASTAAVSDALSTACMVLTEAEIAEIMRNQPDYLAIFLRDGEWCTYGQRQPRRVATDD